MSALIALSNGDHAKVDVADVELLQSYAWCAASAKRPAGAVYAMAWDKTLKRSIYMHRLILGAERGQQVDHVNGDKLDNRRCNLRFANSTLNNANRDCLKSASGYRGVYKASGVSFIASISIEGKNIKLGRYADPRNAALAYDKAAFEAFGAFARLNFSRALGAI